MFLSNTLALFRPPVHHYTSPNSHVHVEDEEELEEAEEEEEEQEQEKEEAKKAEREPEPVGSDSSSTATPASSTRTDKRRTRRPLSSLLSPPSLPPPPQQPHPPARTAEPPPPPPPPCPRAAGVASGSDKHRVPSSKTPPATPPQPHSPPSSAGAASNSTSTSYFPPALSLLVGAQLSVKKTQEGPPAAPHNLRVFSRQFGWNPLFFPAPPLSRGDASLLTKMLKDESNRRRAVSPITIPAGINTSSSNNTPTRTKRNIFSYLSTSAGQKWLDDLEKEALAKKRAKQQQEEKDAAIVSEVASHDLSLGENAGGRESRTGATETLGGSAVEDKGQVAVVVGGNNSEHVRSASVEHVDTGVWNGDVTGQSPSSHLRGADADPSREGVRGIGDGDVSIGEAAAAAAAADATDQNNTRIRSKLSLKDQLKFKESFDQLLQDIKLGSKTSEMGLGRLEFGYPFKLAPRGGIKLADLRPQDTAPAQPAVQAPASARSGPTFSENGIIPQSNAPQARVVLITDAAQNPADLDERALPSGSSVVLIIDQDFQIDFRAPSRASNAPEAVTAPSKPRRTNPLRDTVRLRWRVFHPEYTEKSEFSFETSRASASDIKRKLDDAFAELKTKRIRDDDVEGPVFEEKEASVSEEDEEVKADQQSVVVYEDSMIEVDDASSIAPSEVTLENPVVHYPAARSEATLSDPVVYHPAARSEATLPDPVIYHSADDAAVPSSVTLEDPIVEHPVEEASLVLEDPIVADLAPSSAASGVTLEDPVIFHPTIESVEQAQPVEEYVPVPETIISVPIPIAVEEEEEPGSVEEPVAEVTAIEQIIANEEPISVEELVAVETPVFVIEEPTVTEEPEVAIGASTVVEEVVPVEEPAAIEEPEVVIEASTVVEEVVPVEEPAAIEESEVAIKAPTAVEEPVTIEEPTITEEPEVVIQASTVVEEVVPVEEPAAIEESEVAIKAPTAVEELVTIEEPTVVSEVVAVVEPTTVEGVVSEVEEAADVPSSPITEELPSPPARCMSPIPLEFTPEEESDIKEAIVVAMGEPFLEQPQVEVVEVVEAEVIDLSTLPALPESPALEPIAGEDIEEIADIQIIDSEVEEVMPVGQAPSTEMIRQPSPPPSTPSTPVNGTIRIVPFMPITPPETPLGFKYGGRERIYEFNGPLPLFVTQPNPPSSSSILDSPIFYRGKDRQIEDSPSHYFVQGPPSPVSSSHSILDSPISSRRRRIGETIKEEAEEEEDAKDAPPAIVTSEDEDSDVEEIIRSPRVDSYPSPPASPIESSKGKELARVPSFTIIYSPSPAPSIHDAHMSEDEDGGVPLIRGASPAFDAPASSKGKEKEEIPRSLPSLAMEQEEEREEEYHEKPTRPVLTYGNGWATADDIFLSHPEQYTYTYQYEPKRPDTPSSYTCSLNRRWSGMSRMSYQTGITTPPTSRPGSALGNPKLLGWTDNESSQVLRRSDSFASSIRRERFRESSTARKPLLETTEADRRPVLRWSTSMPLIREQWSIQSPLVLPPRQDHNWLANDDDIEEYDVEVPGKIQILMASRGVIVTPPHVERRRRVRTRPTLESGPHRRKIKSLVIYEPDDQLEGISTLFADLEQLANVRSEVNEAERVVELVDEVAPVKTHAPSIKSKAQAPSVKEPTPSVEAPKEKERKRDVFKRLKTKASAMKEKVKSKVHAHSSKRKGKEVAA